MFFLEGPGVPELWYINSATGDIWLVGSLRNNGTQTWIVSSTFSI